MPRFSKLMLEIDFQYLRLYEFSQVLGTLERNPILTAKLRLSLEVAPGITPPQGSSEYFLLQAVTAAEILLRLILTAQSPTTEIFLRFASSRHYMKIVFAAVFLIQVGARLVSFPH